ncbi:MAG: hypothetical protein EP346_10665 [Bacteroidetes bacterium]|nr:MAG: hypothetical protein EP346_10665 [Bacteroidota bacterium]
MKKNVALSLIALLSCVMSYGQEVVIRDSSDVIMNESHEDSLKEAYSALTIRQWDELSFRPVDSTITVLNHTRLNEWNRDLYGQLSMANLATPLVYLVYDPDVSIGPRSGFQSYFHGWGNARDIPLYDVKAPLSGIRYLSGYERGQLFGGYLTLNAHERLNFFFDFQRVSARGDYFSQDNLSDQVKASSHYRTKNNHYSYQTALLWNKNRGRESGGITNTDGFSNPDSLITNRELINIRWNDSYFKATQFNLAFSQQYLPFADSTGAKGIGVYHEGDFRTSNRTFFSTDSILGNWYLDSAETRDSTRVLSTDQQVGLVFQSGVKGFSYAKVGIGYTYGSLSTDSIRRTQDAVYLSGEVRGETKSFDWRAKGRYHIIGTQVGGFDIRGNLRAELYGLEVGADAIFQNQMPTLQSQQWYGNDFRWNNNWESTYYQKLGGYASYNDYIRFGVNLNNWSRPVYYDESALPMQLEGAMQLIQTELNVRVPLSTWLIVTSKTTFQVTSGSGDILRLPTWVNRSGIFGKWQIYGGALKAYTGLESMVYSKYKANAYMPVTGVFHLQNGQEIGNFFYLNAVAGFRIGTAEIYVLAENVAEGLFNRSYYAAPYYPLADRTIHLGLRWRFFN